MAYTSRDLSNIESAIVSGTAEVEVNGRKVKYRTMNELLKLRDTVKREIAGNTSTGGITWKRANMNQGFDDV